MSNIDREAVIKDIKENAKDLTDVLIILENFPPADDWIPVGDLPKKSGKYLVSGKWESGEEVVDTCEFSTDDGYFETPWTFNVLAWKSPPEPYKGER